MKTHILTSINVCRKSCRFYEIVRKKARNILLRFQYDYGYANAPTVIRKLHVLFLLFLEFGVVT